MFNPAAPDLFWDIAQSDMWSIVELNIALVSGIFHLWQRTTVLSIVEIWHKANVSFRMLTVHRCPSAAYSYPAIIDILGKPYVRIS